MFRKKKSPTLDAGRPVMRGRNSTGQRSGAEPGGGENPLARRFRADIEPATVDLAGPPGFPGKAGDNADPETAVLQTDAAKLSRIISYDSRSGKFYIHPGNSDLPVILQGETVLAPTELRRGDTIRIGDTDIRFGAGT